MTAIPTVVLSNQPGLKACAGSHLPPETVVAIIGALEANGWLANYDAVFAGYMPTPAHVTAACQLIDRVKALNNQALIVVDPILGDDPDGLYLAPDAAEAVRDELVARADIVTPNRFELAWLTGHDITDAASAAEAAASLRRPVVVATSIPAPDRRICNVLVAGKTAALETVLRTDDAPHGTGDFFAGVLTAALLDGEPHDRALKIATETTARVLHQSVGKDHLRFTESR